MIWVINPFDALPSDIGFRPIRFGHLVKELLNRGHSVIWVSSDFMHISKAYRRYVMEESLPKGLEVVLLHTNPYFKNISISRLLNHRQYCKQLSRWMVGRSVPDGIIVSYPLIEAALSSLSYGEKNNVRVVVDIIDIWPDVYLMAVPQIFRRITRMLLINEFRKARKLFTKAKYCVAVSQEYLNYAMSFKKRLNFEYSEVFYLGYDREISVPEKNGLSRLRTLGFNPKDTNFVFVGTLSVSYDIECLIKAAKYIKNIYPKVKFIIGGDGPLKERWQFQAIKLNLDNVKFIGFVDAGIFGILMTHSFAGLASYAPGAFQSIPTKPSEYLAYGLPIISSLVGEFEDLIEREKVGVSYKAGSVDSLISAIEKLIKDPLFANNCRVNAKLLYERKFLAKNIYSQYADDLETLFCKSN